MNQLIRSAFVIAIVGLPAISGGSIIVEWDLASIDQDGISDVSVLSEATDVSASSITATSGFSLISEWGADYPGGFAASGWPSPDFDFTTGTGKYYIFTVTNDTAETLELTGLTLGLLRGDYGGKPGAESWALRSSQDSFVSDIMTYDISSTDFNEQITFDGTASSGKFASALSVNSGEGIEFRLAGYYSSSDAEDYSGLMNTIPGTYGGDDISGDGSNVILHGIVPEPTTMALLVLGGMGCLTRRRRRIHRAVRMSVVLLFVMAGAPLAWGDYNSTVAQAISEVSQVNPTTTSLDSFQEFLIGNASQQDPLHVQRVSSTNFDQPGEMRGYVDTTGNWSPTAGHLEARSHIYSTLNAMGLDATSYQAIDNSNYTNAQNIVGRIDGQDTSKVVVIGAHYDATATRSNGSQYYGYGGSDNATGIAGVLEIARVLSQSKYQVAYTVEFVLFDVEEYRDGWTVGSHEYAAQITQSGRSIEGMISLDMIGYNNDDESVAKICTADSSQTEFRTVMQGVIDDYDLDLTGETYITNGSDHREFTGDNVGMLIEDLNGPIDPTNPYYHKYDDYVITEAYDFDETFDQNRVAGSVQMYDDKEYLDLEYATTMTRLGLGWAATTSELAVVPEPTTMSLLGAGALAILRRRKK